MSASMAAEQLQAFHDEVVLAFRSLSPSAAHELRGRAQREWPADDWYTQYPQGCVAAFIGRVAGALWRLPNHGHYTGPEYPPPANFVHLPWKPWDDVPAPTGHCPS